MAIHERDKEDLVKQATRFPRRAEWGICSGRWDALVAASGAGGTKLGESSGDRGKQNASRSFLFFGVRDNDGWALFVGPDMVLQLNSEGHLRRMYWHGLKLAAEGGQLQRLGRNRRGGRVTHDREILAAEEATRLLACALRVTHEVAEMLAQGDLHWRKGIGWDEATARQELLSRLRQLEMGIRVAKAPNAR